MTTRTLGAARVVSLLLAGTILSVAQQPATSTSTSPVQPLPANRPVPPQGPGSPLGTLPPLSPPPPALADSAPGRIPDDYPIAAEAERRAANVPAGKVEFFEFSDSKVFPETSRGVWVYIPAQYDAAKPASLMVFQDGHAYVSTNGRMRVPIVFDNLIASGQMPVTVGVFINPGHRGNDAPPANGWGNRSNRSVEYDSLGADYANFLINELLPAVTTKYGLKLSPSPEDRAISGMSSGGICAFTVAWERPDQFGRVLSHIGSFVNIRGGHVYPALIRKTPRKPLRIFLQDGSNDLNNLHGDWPLSNQQMAGSLAFAGYDHRFVFGDGAHNDRHGAAILPDSLRWLWRASKATAPVPSELTAGDWQLVSEGHGFTDGACAGPDGSIYFADLTKAQVWRILPGGKPEVWIDSGPKLSGLKFGPDGLLYAASQGGPGDQKQRIVVIHPTTRAIETVASGVKPNDLVVSMSGQIFFTDTGAGQVVTVPTSARNLSGPRPLAGGIVAPNGIALAPDQSTLFVSEYQGTNVWSIMLSEPGRVPMPVPFGRGSASPRILQAMGAERISPLVVPADKKVSGGDGSTTSGDQVFVTSHAGIQVFHTSGQAAGIIPNPTPGSTPVSCVVAGVPGRHLYVCDGPRVWRRPLR